jgi:hypothetical protein
MSTSQRLWIGLAAAVWLYGAAGAAGQNLDLNGYWQSDAEGTVRVNHDLATGYVWIDGSPCPNGAQRPFTLSGALDGNTLSGSMWRCTNQELIDKCGHPPIYHVRFDATASLDPITALWRNGEIEMTSMRINANWLMEHYIVQNCQEKRKEARADLFFVSRSNPQSTPTTSPGTAPPPLSQTCTWTGDVCEYWSCMWHRYGIGSPPQGCR